MLVLIMITSLEIPVVHATAGAFDLILSVILVVPI